MLESLTIAGLGVIDSAEVELGPGLTVLTGETGAGKSMLVDAVALLLGARGESGLVRPGAPKALIEGAIELGGGVKRDLLRVDAPTVGAVAQALKLRDALAAQHGRRGVPVGAIRGGRAQPRGLEVDRDLAGEALAQDRRALVMEPAPAHVDRLDLGR